LELAGKCFKIDYPPNKYGDPHQIDFCFLQGGKVQDGTVVDRDGWDWETTWRLEQDGQTLYIGDSMERKSQKCTIKRIPNSNDLDVSCGWSGRWIEKRQ
jgi:hypothetical protein